MSNHLKYDPNPGYGRITVVDAVRAFAGSLIVLGQSLLFLLSRPLRSPQTPWRTELQTFATRKHVQVPQLQLKPIPLTDFGDRVLAWMPISILRRPGKMAKVYLSHRYRQRLRGLPEVVDRHDFCGSWLTKPGFHCDADLDEADVVLLFAHGGGYVMGQPAQYAGLLLRVAEGVEAKGLKTAVFALDYSLAPEQRFPRQLEQMAACWEYIVGELGVSASKIALAGDSAGGSLCLSFLAHMQSPASGLTTVLRHKEKPGRGLFLVSPWISLIDETGYEDFADSDVLDISTLRSWAQAVTEGVDDGIIRQYLDFARLRTDLGLILPRTVWVSAGDQEIFHQNIGRFVKGARGAGLDVVYDVKDDAAHDWQLSEALKDQDAFLQEDFGSLSSGLMGGAAALADAIAFI